MTESRSLGIELDSDRAVFSIGDGDSRRQYSVPTRLAVASDGIKIGHSTDRGASQRVFERLFDVGDYEGVQVDKLPLTVFFEKAVSMVRAEISGEESDSVIFDSVSIGIPGGCPPQVVEAVEAAAAEAGLSSPMMYRRPTQIAHREENSLEPDGVLLGVSITAEEASFGVYEKESGGRLRVLGRSTSTDLGLRSLSERLAESLLEKVGRQRDGSVEVTEQAIGDFAAFIRKSARENQERLLDGEDFEVEYELSEGAALTVGEHTLEESIQVNDVIDYGERLSALEEHSETVMEALKELLAATSLEPADINYLVAYGDGYATDVIEEAVFGIIGTETPAKVYGTNNAGADALLRRSVTDEAGGVSETLPYLVQIQGAGTDGIQSETITPVLKESSGEHRFSLSIVDDKQQQGRFGLEFVLPSSEQVAKRFDVAVHGLPVTGSSDELELEFVLTAHETTPRSPEDIDIKIVDSELAEGIEIEVGHPETTESDPSWEIPWLGVSSDDEIPLIEPSETEKTHLTRRDTKSEAQENLGRDDIAEVVHKTRSNLWEWAVVKERELSPSATSSILRELDQRLERLGVEFYVPELGTITEHGRHQVRKQEPSHEDEGAIIEVLKPGMKIEDIVVEPALVTISNGQPPAKENDEEPASETESPQTESTDGNNKSEGGDSDLSTGANE